MLSQKRPFLRLFLLEQKMKKKLLIFFSFLIVLLIAGYFLWNYFTSPTGDQKVIFTPARPQHFTSGNLNYTIYQAENNIRGDTTGEEVCF
jgi:hypothetical protein